MQTVRQRRPEVSRRARETQAYSDACVRTCEGERHEVGHRTRARPPASLVLELSLNLNLPPDRQLSDAVAKITERKASRTKLSAGDAQSRLDELELVLCGMFRVALHLKKPQIFAALLVGANDTFAKKVWFDKYLREVDTGSLRARFAGMLETEAKCHPRFCELVRRGGDADDSPRFGMMTGPCSRRASRHHAESPTTNNQQSNKHTLPDIQFYSPDVMKIISDECVKTSRVNEGNRSGYMAESSTAWILMEKPLCQPPLFRHVCRLYPLCALVERLR